MLIDKNQLLNRLEYSGCTIKSNFISNQIKSPYLAQYKIFEERLKNPKMKTMSMIMRKRKILQNQDKENIQKQLINFQQNQCLSQARKIIQKDQNQIILFPSNTIDYDVNQTSKQSEVMLKFKEKLFDLKIIKEERNNNERRRVSSFSFSSQNQRCQKSQIGSCVGKQRLIGQQLKPQTAEVINNPRKRVVLKEELKSLRNSEDKKLKLPITFIGYKRNKSFAEKYTKDKR